MSQFWSLVLQSALFVLGVYVQKFVRKRMFNREQGKQIKQTSRIVTCTIVTMAILLFNFKWQCASYCFYLEIDLVQCLQVIVMNTLLFSTHLYYKITQNGFDFSRYSLKSVFVAPFLQQLLFRASFYRSAHTSLSIYSMSLLFSVSHLHRPIRKWLKGKNPRWGATVGQIIFTFIFGIYSFLFLAKFSSVIPSIVLHCYCNFLGPPSINKTTLSWHSLSIVLAIAYYWIFI